jgi:predicted nucleic acid-binding protein
LLDTNIAILLRDGVADVKARILDLNEAPALSAVTRVELEGGVYARPELAEQRRRAVDALLQELEVIDFDDEMVAAYGGIVAEAGFSRRKIIDRMIAATALVNGLTLITCNPADFQDVSDLKLEVWPVF